MQVQLVSTAALAAREARRGGDEAGRLGEVGGARRQAAQRYEVHRGTGIAIPTA